jgi:hypothetical protein
MDTCLDNIQEKIHITTSRESSSSFEPVARSGHWKNTSYSFSTSVISFRKIQDSSEGVKTITSAKVNEMLKNDAKYIQQYKSLYYASIATFFTIVIYIFSWIIFGAVFLTIALSQQPMEDNLHERNFSYFQNGLYLTISAFSNAGLSLSGDSFLHMNTNAGELTFH